MHPKNVNQVLPSSLLGPQHSKQAAVKETSLNWTIFTDVWESLVNFFHSSRARIHIADRSDLGTEQGRKGPALALDPGAMDVFVCTLWLSYEIMPVLAYWGIWIIILIRHFKSNFGSRQWGEKRKRPGIMSLRSGTLSVSPVNHWCPQRPAAGGRRAHCWNAWKPWGC